NPVLTTIAEDTTNPAGTLVRTFASAAITDPDAGALKGIAVTSASSFYGTWQFSLNGGTTWRSMGNPTNSAALLLPANSSTMVRFIPKADFNGQVHLWYRAWDRTQGT